VEARLEILEIGRRDWTRTNDPHHVKVTFSLVFIGFDCKLWPFLWPTPLQPRLRNDHMANIDRFQ